MVVPKLWVFLVFLVIIGLGIHASQGAPIVYTINGFIVSDEQALIKGELPPGLRVVPGPPMILRCITFDTYGISYPVHSKECTLDMSIPSVVLNGGK